MEDAVALTFSLSGLHRPIIIRLTIPTSVRCGGETGSDAGGCSFQDWALRGPSFWGGRVDGVGPTPGPELHQRHELGAPA